MARLFIDGFEDQDPYFGLWDYVYGNVENIAPVDSGLKSQAIRIIQDNIAFLQKNIGTKTELYCSFVLCPSGVMGSMDRYVFALKTAGVAVPTFYFGTTSWGQVKIKYMKTTPDVYNEVTTSNNIFIYSDVGKYVELYMKYNTAGAAAFSVKIDGETVIDENSLTTATANFESVQFGSILNDS